MTSKSLITFINKQTGIEHEDIRLMSDEEKKGNCVVYVSNYDYRKTLKYVKRIRTNTGKWYASEIAYEEFCYWVAHSQMELFKKMNEITQSTSGMNIDDMIYDAVERMKKYQAIEDELCELPEEDLIDEDTFRKMMGEQ